MTTSPTEQGHKWGGTATADLPSAAAGDVWSLLSVFGGLHRWLPSIAACRLVSGVDGVPGCVRCCATAGEEPQWCNEELLDFDMEGRSYRYKITENNMGMREYVATLAVIPVGGGGGGCRVEWSFVADPVKGWTEEGFVAYLRTGVEGMAARAEEALKAAAAAAAAAE